MGYTAMLNDGVIRDELLLFARGVVNDVRWGFEADDELSPETLLLSDGDEWVMGTYLVVYPIGGYTVMSREAFEVFRKVSDV